MDRASLCVGGGGGGGGGAGFGGAEEEALITPEVAGLHGTSGCTVDGSSTGGAIGRREEGLQEVPHHFWQVTPY